jgi:hypothetical protein
VLLIAASALGLDEDREPRQTASGWLLSHRTREQASRRSPETVPAPGRGYRSGVVCESELLSELTVAALERGVDARAAPAGAPGGRAT